MTSRDRERLEFQQQVQSLTNEKTELSDKVKLMEHELSKISSSGKKAVDMLLQQKDEQIAKIKSEAEAYFEQWKQEKRKMEKEKNHLVSQIQTMEKNSMAEIAQLRYQAGQEIEALKKKLGAPFHGASRVGGGEVDLAQSTTMETKEAKSIQNGSSKTIEKDQKQKKKDTRRTLSFDSHNGMVRHDTHF